MFQQLQPLLNGATLCITSHVVPLIAPASWARLKAARPAREKSRHSAAKPKP
jgi:hypothetical protein